MQHLRHSLCLVLVAGAAALAQADSVSIISVADNTLYQSADGGLSNGAGSAMFAGMNAFPPTIIRRCVLRFDVAGSITAGRHITGALLSLSQNGQNADPVSCDLHRLLASWGEGTSVAGGGQGGGGLATAGDATWLHRFWSGTPWTTPGGDFAATVTATSSVGGAGTYTWSSAQLIADIQSMLDAPASNFGWILRGNEEVAQTTKKFSTREDLEPSVRPTLFIEFSSPCPGDLNNDGLVDDSDFVIFAAAYDILDCADPSMPSGCLADLSGDGAVDDSDFVMFVGAYNDLLCP